LISATALLVERVVQRDDRGHFHQAADRAAWRKPGRPSTSTLNGITSSGRVAIALGAQPEQLRIGRESVDHRG